MDLEHVLFGLSSFVNDCEEKKLKVDNIYKESYLKLLDQLAVLLRDEALRNHELIRLNLSKFIECADYLLLNIDSEGYKELLLEVIRVLANSIADDDTNRKQLASKTEFIKHLDEHLVKNPNDDSLNERILILLKNSVIDTPDVAQKIAFVTQSLLSYVQTTNGDKFMAVDLLCDLVQYMKYKADPVIILKLLNLLSELFNQKPELDDDEFAEFAYNLSTILENITLDPRFKFDSPDTERSLQFELFDILKKVELVDFQNKLMFQRKLFASIGNISANLSTSNKPLKEFTTTMIKDTSQKNGYIISGCFTILGNSISSSSERNEVLDQSPTLIDDMLSKYNYLVDPVQFQGILHLLKTLINFDTVGCLFTEKNFKVLESLIEATVRNSKYYTNFTSLLTGFLKKLFVLLNQKHIEQIMKSDIPNHLTSSDATNESNTIILLLLNKIVLYKTDADLDIFCSRIFKFPNDIQAGYLFELTKTVGVLLKNKSDYVLQKYTPSLVTLLTTIDSVDPYSSDNAAKAVLNNGRYISGTLLNISKDKPIDSELENLSNKILRK